MANHRSLGNRPPTGVVSEAAKREQPNGQPAARIFGKRISWRRPLPYRLLLDKLKAVVRKSPLLERSIRRVLDRRYQMARKYLGGIGIEIGALDRPLTLPRQAKAYYLDRLFPEQLRVHYPELSHKRFHVSIVGDGEQLAFVRNGALDFLVANHLIEHCEDPIATLETFAKKLRPCGIIFMAVPDMRRTFDRNRDETTWEHLLDDHKQGPHRSRLRHYREWSSKVKGLTGEAAERLAAQLSDTKYSIHFHCWTKKGFTDFVERMRLIAPLNLLEMRSWKNENIFVLTKTSPSAIGWTFINRVGCES